MTVPGPFTMSQQAQDDHYGDPAALGWPTPRRCGARSSTCSRPAPTSCRSTSPTCRRARRRRASTGSPCSSTRPTASPGRPPSTSASATPRSSTTGRAATRSCPSCAATECDQISIETGQSGLALDVLDSLAAKTIILGVLDLSTDEVETPETVAERIRRAFPHAGPERLIAAPDCGMKYLTREAAYGKLESLVAGARLAAPSVKAIVYRPLRLTRRAAARGDPAAGRRTRRRRARQGPRHVDQLVGLGSPQGLSGRAPQPAPSGDGGGRCRNRRGRRLRVTRFRPGDQVFGDVSHEGWGGLGEYVCARERAWAAMPAGLTFEQAAAVPQAGVLALQGLAHRRPVAAGRRRC